MKAKKAKQLCEELADVLDDLETHLLDADAIPPNLLQGLTLDLDRASKALQGQAERMANAIREHRREEARKALEQKAKETKKEPGPKSRRNPLM
jgi:hypothetical protein